MMKLENAETDHDKVGKLYERVLVLSDFKETEKDSLAFREIESLFYNMRGLVWEAQATHRNKRAIKPKESVAKEVAKASAPGDSNIMKNLQKTTEPTMKLSAAEEGEKLCKEPPKDKGQEDPTALNGASEAKAGERPPGGPLDRLRALKVIMEVQIEQMGKMLESNHSLSATEIRAKIYDLDKAWGKLGKQYYRLKAISGRG